MSKKVLIGIIVVVIVVGLAITGITLGNKRLRALTADEKSQITTLVEDFGKKLKSVDLLSPEEMIVQSIQQNYSPYLTANLLMKWTFDPYQAIGRFVSSPWPDRIEIDSMERIDDNTVKVKGYVIWVVSGNGTLDVTDRVPAVLIVKKDSSTQKFLIDNGYSNKYAFYDTKELIKILQEAFPEIDKIVTPYISKVLTIGKNMDEILIVDLGVGGTYTEYYTICKLSKDKLIPVDFKNKDRTLGKKSFAEDASVTNERRLTIEQLSEDDFYIYYYTIDKDDEGNIANITVDAYKWNTDARMFEYDSAAADEFKNKLQKSITPEVVNLKDLKFKEIKSTFPAIGTVTAVYGSKIVFSCGTEKSFVNNPSGSISHIALYDTITGKIKYLCELKKPWVNIDKIQVSYRWILFKAVEDPVGAPVECFAFDMDTNELKVVIPKNFEGKFVIVDDIALIDKDYAYVELDVYDSEKTFNTGILPSKKIVEVYLPYGTTRTIFDETKEDNYSKITNFQVSDEYLLITTELDPNKKPPANVTVLPKGLLWMKRIVGSGGVEYGDMPNNLIGDNFICTPDGYMLFQNNGKIAKISIDDLVHNKNNIVYFPNFIGINQYFLGVTASSEYIVVIDEDSKHSTNVKGKNGNIYTLTPSLISVYNMNTGKTKSISDNFAVDAVIQGSTLVFINHLQDADTPDSIIFLNLKSNGF